MIDGCSNHGCSIKGETGGMHTNGICKCVGSARASSGYEIVVGGERVGPELSMSECIIIMRWLKGGGLRDILALERKEQNEELVILRKMVDDYQMWLDEARQQLAQHVQWLKDARSEFHIE